jgi:hypothetical protein
VHWPLPAIVIYTISLGQLRRFPACSPTRHLVCHLNEKLNGRTNSVMLKASMTERIAQGLYDPAFERDSCGFGLIANLDDMPSHWVVETAISALARLTIRHWPQQHAMQSRQRSQKSGLRLLDGVLYRLILLHAASGRCEHCRK